MRTAAVLPVKSFGRAKQRLDAAVGQRERAELAAAMLGDVLAALRAAGGLSELIVVTAEPRAARAARAARAQLVDDPVEAGQSDAAARGVRAAVARGAQRVLLVPGDCPALGPGSFARHAVRGAAAGARVRVAHAPSLELDVDTPGDLAALCSALRSLPAAAPRTRALLETLAPSSAVA